MIGIYAITCTANGRVYIGSSLRIEKRWGEHRQSLRRGCHRNPHIQRAWKKYGESAFEFSVLIECHAEDLLDMEQSTLDAQKLYGPVFNIGDDCDAPARGRKHTPETRAKISAAARGRKLSPEACANMSMAAMGRVNTPESRAKMSAAHLGVPRTPETRAKISAGLKGRRVSPETRAKISSSLKNRP